MANRDRPNVVKARALALFVALMAAGVTSIVSASPAAAAVTEVKGSACGYYVNVGLFGGPQNLRGCDQTAGGDASASPKVTLPAGGSATPVTGSNPAGAKATYGPAAIFSGIWPESQSSAPPSGPISVSTEGTPGGGSVKSSADIVLRTPADPSSPGGFGPGPVEGDELHSTCTANETGITGAATFKNGKLTLTTDAGGAPLTQEPIPDNPPANYTRSGILTNVGDVFSVVFNQQIVNSDGSLTINAFHMYLFGPVAVGESIGGQVTCGVAPSPLNPADTIPPTCGAPVIAPTGPEDPTPLVPARVLIGVFDAGGLASVTTPQVTNGTGEIGAGGQPYLQFSPGMTGPIVIHATRADEGQPMSFSFTATDKAGNSRDVKVDVTAGSAAAASAQCPSNSAPLTNAQTVGVGDSSSSSSVTTIPGTSAGSGSGSASTAAGNLGNTGMNVRPWALTAIALIVIGGLMVVSTGRRRGTPDLSSRRV